MKTETIQHGEIRLTVSEASLAMGARRMSLLSQAIQTNEREREAAEQEGGPLVDDYLQSVRLMFPALASATISAEGITWPMTFESFYAEVPETLPHEWNAAVERLNPHWYPTSQDADAEPTDEDQKKAMISTGASPGG